MLKLYKLLNLPYITWLKNALVLTLFFLSVQITKAQTTCKAGFTYTIVSNEVWFKNTSTNSSGNPMKYIWNFGDRAENYSVENPKHYYYSDGKYVVTLAVVDTVSNCYNVFKDTVDYKFDYNAICNAEFTYSVKPYILDVTFNMTHWVSRDKKRTWIFGDGDTSKNDTAWSTKKHTYASYGTYNACLVIADSSKKCVDTFCYTINIQKPADLDSCKGSFTYDIYINQVGFRPYITCGKWTPNSYYWDFGDGDTSHSQYPVHKYKTHGIYDVTLVVGGTGGAIAKTLKNKVYLQNFCVPKTHSIYTKDLNLTMNIYLNKDDQFVIDFGDGTSVNKLNKDSNITHLYATPGKYKVKFLKTNTSLGCKDSTFYDVTVKAPVWCFAKFGTEISESLKRSVRTYVNTYNFAGADSSFFEWDFGDGYTYSGIGKYDAYHQYLKDGVYKISLKVSNAKYSCVDTSSRFVTIYTRPSSINVKVRIDANTHVDSALVYLVQVDDSVNHTLTALDTGLIVNASGSQNGYEFTNFPPGKYTVKAALIKNSKYYHVFFPTYYNSSLKWADADAIYILDYNNARGIEIILKLGVNPGGPGFIGGKISTGANKKEGDPLENIQVMLFNENAEPVTYTYSDAEGNFKFENLALGKYEVYTEVMGIKTNSAYVTLTDNNPKVENVEVKVSSKGISTSIRTILGEDFISQPKLYPNPTQNILYLETDLRKSQNSNLVIYNITGKAVYTEEISLQQGKQTHTVATENLPAGAYILMLKNASGVSQLQARFMKY